MQCIFSHFAELDLEQLCDYLARDNPPRAFSFIRQLREQCSKIAATPQAAPLRDELGEDIRIVPLWCCLIFYRVDSDSIRVERILHETRDIRDLFGI